MLFLTTYITDQSYLRIESFCLTLGSRWLLEVVGLGWQGLGWQVCVGKLLLLIWDDSVGDTWVLLLRRSNFTQIRRRILLNWWRIVKRSLSYDLKHSWASSLTRSLRILEWVLECVTSIISKGSWRCYLNIFELPHHNLILSWCGVYLILLYTTTTTLLSIF